MDNINSNKLFLRIPHFLFLEPSEFKEHNLGQTQIGIQELTATFKLCAEWEWCSVVHKLPNKNWCWPSRSRLRDYEITCNAVRQISTYQQWSFHTVHSRMLITSSILQINAHNIFATYILYQIPLHVRCVMHHPQGQLRIRVLAKHSQLFYSVFN